MSITDENRPVLVVCEDHKATRELLCDQLEAEGFEVVPAGDARDAVRLTGLKRPDVVLLDIGLPDGNGLSVLDAVRSGVDIDPETPVIVVSGRGHDYDRLRGFEHGASDYLAKPVFVPELVARIRVQLARRRGATERKVGELVLDPEARDVRVADRTVPLSAKEYSLLRMLMTDPHRVFTKQELLRDVWGYRSLAHTRTLDSHASRLRRKLDPKHRRYVVNVWGVGYRLCDPERPDEPSRQGGGRR